METFYFESPSISRKEEAFEFLQEFVDYNSPFNGMGGMDECLNGLSYEDWLDELEKRKNPVFLKQMGRCPANVYFLVRSNDKKIVGMSSIRYNISREQLDFGVTHIGYGIRPSERRKGYNKINLYLGLLEEQRLGEVDIVLDCTVDNIGSNKTILSLGGHLEKTFLDNYDNEMTNYYSINVNKSISKYSSQYEKYITRGKELSK